MNSPLRILHLEDDRNDAALIQSTLKAGGIECVTTRVETEADFVSELELDGIDLILSDFSLPAFDGLSALKIARALRPELPVIFVSGTLGEELAIDSLKNGATDYVLKERLGRLAPAVGRAMQDVKDRAERKRLQTQFIEGQKMEVIGQLAAGVAHDFNNILGVIMGYSELLTSDLSPESAQWKFAEEIWLASKRAAGLTGQLLVFSRKQIVQPVVLDLNEVLADLDKMLRRLLDASIEMTLVPGEQIGRIRADAGYLGQVLMNLVVNASDAMPHGGTLTIATGNIKLDDDHAHTHPGAAAGEYVMLSVGDTGTGMSAEVKARLFEAFFTTKPSGKGTGLGLATCQTIVQQSGGHIGIDSEIGRGTTFRIYFPRVWQPAPVAPRSVQADPLPRGTETLLVVEDEQTLSQLAVGILAAQGYHVLSASNGQDALTVAGNHKGPPIRLVISDLIMPRMGGKAMAEQLRSAHPDLKILFSSGYAEEAITHHELFGKGIEFLPKPYQRAILLRKVREILDS
jgi:two-component system, cell cycle sensor histidine kinase and response regulator CckA